MKNSESEETADDDEGYETRAHRQFICHSTAASGGSWNMVVGRDQADLNDRHT